MSTNLGNVRLTASIFTLESILFNTSVNFYRSIVTFNISIMSRKNKNQTNIWIAIEAIFLIILLIIWLTVADFTGDTDVAAFIAPAFSGLTFLKL